MTKRLPDRDLVNLEAVTYGQAAYQNGYLTQGNHSVPPPGLPGMFRPQIQN